MWKQKMKALALAVVIILSLPATGEARLAPGDFIDIKGSWAEQPIETACSLGLMQGTGVTPQGYKVFNPNAMTTRAQLAVALVNTFDPGYGQVRFVKKPSVTDYYRDVAEKDWYAQAALLCAVNQILEGSWDYCFHPGQTVTRMELASAVVNSLTAKGITLAAPTGTPAFQDIKDLSDDEARTVAVINQAGIMCGYGGYFRPNAPVTRAELAAVLTRGYRLTALDKSKDGQTVTIMPGQKLTICLPFVPADGYSCLFQPWDEQVLANTVDGVFLGGSQFLNQKAGEGNMCWVFRGVNPGTTRLHLIYARPWESRMPEHTFDLTVTVVDKSPEPEGIVLGTDLIASHTAHMDVKLAVPQLSGMSDTVKEAAINSLLMNNAVSFKEDVASELDDYVAGASLYGYPLHRFVAESQYEKCLQNPGIISLYVDNYGYTGGAHGMTIRKSFNIDLKEGKVLTLGDIFKPGFDYRSTINQEIRRQINASLEEYFPDEGGFKGISDDQGWYVKDGALVIFFQPYDIAPYAAGIPEFELPFSIFAGNLQLHQ